MIFIRIDFIFYQSAKQVSYLFINVVLIFTADGVRIGRPPKNSRDIAREVAQKAIYKDQRFHCAVSGCETSFAFQKDVCKHVRIEHTKTANVSTIYWAVIICLGLRLRLELK